MLAAIMSLHIPPLHRALLCGFVYIYKDIYMNYLPQFQIATCGTNMCIYLYICIYQNLGDNYFIC